MDNSPEAVRTMLHRFAHGTAPMGDLVGKQTPNQAGKHPSLFGNEASQDERAEVRDKLGETHLIRNLTLYVSPNRPDLEI